MNPIIDLLFTAIIFCTIVCLWLFFNTKYQEYRIDLTRQRLFELRDALFDVALSGDLDFNSKAYGLCRKTINGMIRYCHKLTLLHVLAILFVCRHQARSINENYLKMKTGANEGLDENQKKIIEKFYTSMNLVILTRVIYSSLILLLPFRAIIFGLKLFNLITHARTKFVEWAFAHGALPMGLIDAKAKEIGGNPKYVDATV